MHPHLLNSILIFLGEKGTEKILTFSILFIHVCTDQSVVGRLCGGLEKPLVLQGDPQGEVGEGEAGGEEQEEPGECHPSLGFSLESHRG